MTDLLENLKARIPSLWINPQYDGGKSPAGFGLSENQGIAPENVTHILWTTGGRYLPDPAEVEK